ncbi:MAG TPA: cyclic nucleotide-binding domain-containing protein [Longimicrobiales bacterium]|nr:cyclic nucleotide-binding domain-containing protein [Longimicrobiales bacterium]
MGTGTATEQVVQVLGRLPLFQALPRTDLERIAELVGPRELREGEFLFREGDVGDRFYIVHSGVVEVLKERPLGDHERIALKRRGDAFGEMSLLNDAPRSASVRAVEPTRLLAISRSDFDELMGGESFSVRLLRGLARAVRAMDVRFAARDAGGADALRQFGLLVLRGLEPRAAPQLDGYQIAGATARGEEGGGGSLWDTLTTEDGRTLLALMDVKGAGLPPAYLIAITRALFHEIAPSTPFEEVLQRLNAGTFRNLFEGMDECVEAAIIEIHQGGVRWSCAGNQPAVILRADGSTEEATAHGPPLGILPQFDYGVTELALAPGDTLLAFSEAPAGLIRGAVDLARGRSESGPPKLAQLLQAALQTVQAGAAETDLAFVVVRRNG